MVYLMPWHFCARGTVTEKMRLENWAFLGIVIHSVTLEISWVGASGETLLRARLSAFGDRSSFFPIEKLGVIF